mmetsp:Transcript_23064/g.34931  ORF Transcript_23064/g.34931 Transcript_23064/m.34931 type:complete len:171 (+) Transcript_23064:48-560(+)
MPSSCSPLSLCIIALSLLSSSVEGFGTTPSSNIKLKPAAVTENSSRRSFLSNTFATAAALSIPQLANARYVLNEETGDYDEVTDKDWQTTWKERLEKAQTMGTEDVFLAAQGAGNLDLKEGIEESDASKKRRAMAGCRNDGFRAKSGEDDVKVCTKRVLSGDFQFMIDAM